jgi:hypothetical protein
VLNNHIKKVSNKLVQRKAKKLASFNAKQKECTCIDEEKPKGKH